MNFDPASGYEAALGVLRQVYIPTRDKNEVQPPKPTLGAVNYSQTPATAMSYSPLNASIHAAGHLATTTNVQSHRHHDLPAPHDKGSLHRPFDMPSSSVQGSPYRSNDSTTSIPLPSLRVESRAISTSDGRLEGQVEQQSKEPFSDKVSKTDLVSRLSHIPPEGIARSNMIMGPPIERPRPLTSPLRYQLHDTLAELHPPKRILPFPELSLKPVEADPIEDGPTEDSVQAQPTDAKKGVTKEKAKVQKGKKSSSTASKSARAVSSSGPACTTNKTSKSTTGSAPKPSSTTSRATKMNSRKASPIVEKDLAETSSPLPSPKAPMPYKKKRSTATKAKEVPSTIVTETYMKSVDEFVRKHTPRPSPIAPALAPVSDLEDYAKMPEIMRLEEVDKLIMKYIEDDNFVILCEDVEKSWKRVGLNA